MTASSIQIGSHLVPQIKYQQIKPGDFLCTYEVLTTRPDFLFLEFSQKYASFYQRKELNKMFHGEVIVRKYPREGIYQIAHGDFTLAFEVGNAGFQRHDVRLL